MFRMRIKIVENKPPDIARQAFRDICKRGFSHIANIWYREIFPKHFRVQAKNAYQHQPRTEGYKKKKKRMAARGKVAMGGTVDNVFTGAMMRQLKSGCIIRAFPTRGKVTMTGPDYLKINFKNMGQAKRHWWNRSSRGTGSPQPNKKRELTTLTREETRYLLREFKRFVTDEFNKYRGARRIKTF